jgi:catechol 2,3-dioxygenase-like lactoylglutathione lyase family enzyme
MHHVGLRVADIERATRFYGEVFGARVELDVPLSSDMTEHLYAADPGTTSHARALFFEDGAIELFEFDPSAPTTLADQKTANLMHVCLYVDDVPGTAERVVAAGGSAFFPPMEWGPWHFGYVADPDGNVIELLDADHQSWIRGAAEQDPDLSPA